MFIPQEKLKYWIWGGITAFLGVAVARLLPNYYPSSKIIFIISGVNLSLIGLFIISLGTRKKKQK